MSYEKIKSLFGKRLLTLLLVPAVLGCNFTAIHASADETIAAMESAENEAPEQEESSDNANEEQNNENDAQDQGEESQDEESQDDNQENSEGEESGESSDSSEGSEEGEGSEGDDAASSGATPEEGDNTDAGEGASTGASTDNPGSDSSTDATSADSSDASDASSDASSDDSADASSSASSEDASDASGSASSDDEWEDEDVSENSAGDVSDNDAEDEEVAEFMVSPEEVFKDGIEAIVIENQDGSKDVCLPMECVENNEWTFLGVSKVGELESEIFPEVEALVEQTSMTYNAYRVYSIEDSSFESESIWIAAKKDNNVVEMKVKKPKIYVKGNITKAIEGYTAYPAKKDFYLDDYDFHYEYYINPKKAGDNGVEYSVSNVSMNDSVTVEAVVDKKFCESVTTLKLARVEDMNTHEVYMSADEDGNVSLPEDFLPLMPVKLVYTIVPKKQYLANFYASLGATEGHLSIPEHVRVNAQVNSATKTVGQETSETSIFFDDESPRSELIIADPENHIIESRDLSTPINEGEKVYVQAYDDRILEVESYDYSYILNNGVTGGASDMKGAAAEDGAKTACVEIEIAGPGIYTVNNAVARDYALNISDRWENSKTFMYDPYAPKMSSAGLTPAGETEDGEITYPFGSEVTLKIEMEGGVFTEAGHVADAVQKCVKAYKAESRGDAEAAYTYACGDISYDGTKYTVPLTFKGVGAFRVSIDSTAIEDDCHLAVEKTSGDVARFVIEPDIPEATKLASKKGESKNGFYYRDAVVESVSFDRKNIEKYIYIENNEAGLPTKTPKLEFEQNGKNTIAKAVMDEDGRYSFSICYRKRKSDKPVYVEFETYVIDRKAPEVTFTEVENFSANNGVVAPVINCFDENMDKTVSGIKLTGSNNGEVQINSTLSESYDGITISCADFAREKKNDDLYTLEATVMDLAGNEAKQTLTFSVNRFGSVFVLGEDTKAMNQQYYVKDPMDVTITEINVDDLVTRNVSVTRDGNIKKLNGETDYRVSKQGDNTSWKTYTYNVARTNFEKDGVYSVSLYTKDRATNEMDNKSRDAEIEFAVDRTAPSIVAADIEDNGVYKEESHSFNVDVTDNMGLVSFTVYNNGKEVQAFTGKEVEADGNVETITLEESSNPQNITLIATDVAGNKQTVVFKDVLVSRKEKKAADTTTTNKPSTTTGETGTTASTTGSTEQTGNGTGNSGTGAGGELTKDEFPYKTAGAVAVAVACVAAAGGAGFMIRRRKQKKA